jgi:hypothetical protein
MSKGDRPRPPSIPLSEYNKNLDTIFGVKEPKARWVPPPLPEEVIEEKSNVWEISDTKQGD